MRMMMTTRRCQSCHGVQPDYWKKQDILNKGYKIAQYFNNNNINNINNSNIIINNNSNPKNSSTSPSNKPVKGELLSSVGSAGKVDDRKESHEVRVARLKARFAHVIAKYSGNTKIEKCDEEEKIIKRKDDGHQVNTKAVDRRLQERQLARLALEKLEQTVQVDDYGLVKKFEELAGCSVSGSGYAGSCSAWKKSLKNLGLVMKTGYGY